MSDKIGKLERLLAEKQKVSYHAWLAFCFFQLLTLFYLLFRIQENIDEKKKHMIKHTQMSVLVIRVESDTVKHIVGMENKCKKVRKIVDRKKGLGMVKECLENLRR